jgi:hypothetical protein
MLIAAGISLLGVLIVVGVSGVIRMLKDVEYLLDYTNRQQTAEFLRDFNAAMREHASRQK